MALSAANLKYRITDVIVDRGEIGFFMKSQDIKEFSQNNH